MVQDKVGRRLKRLRELAGVSQAAVAHLMEWDRAYISMIESGYRNISQDDTTKIENFLQQEQKRNAREFASFLATPATAMASA